MYSVGSIHLHPPYHYLKRFCKSNGPTRFVEAWELDLGELVRPLGSQALCSFTATSDSQWPSGIHGIPSFLWYPMAA
jgi:hypothetical protein